MRSCPVTWNLVAIRAPSVPDTLFVEETASAAPADRHWSASAIDMAMAFVLFMAQIISYLANGWLMMVHVIPKTAGFAHAD